MGRKRSMAKSQSGKPGTPELLVISRYLSMANWFGPNVLGDKISQRPRRRLTRSAMKLGTDKRSSQPSTYHLVRHLCDVVVIMPLQFDHRSILLCRMCDLYGAVEL